MAVGILNCLISKWKSAKSTFSESFNECNLDDFNISFPIFTDTSLPFFKSPTLGISHSPLTHEHQGFRAFSLREIHQCYPTGATLFSNHVEQKSLNWPSLFLNVFDHSVRMALPPPQTFTKIDGQCWL